MEKLITRNICLDDDFILGMILGHPHVIQLSDKTEVLGEWAIDINLTLI